MACCRLTTRFLHRKSSRGSLWIASRPLRGVPDLAEGDVQDRQPRECQYDRLQRQQIHSLAGGLVGVSYGSITACYATGDVSSSSSSSDSFAGGLVGERGTTITASYYDSDATITGETNTTGTQTKAALQGPTDGTGIYATWIQLELDDYATEGIDDRTQAGDAAYDLAWDFGTATQYPALKIDFDGKDVTPTATVAEFGPQRATKFRRSTYDFFVRANAASGAVVDTVRAMVADYDYMLSYSIVSQAVGTAVATTSGFAFDISNKTVRASMSVSLK